MTSPTPLSPEQPQPYQLADVMPSAPPKRSRAPWIIGAVAAAVVLVGAGIAIASATGDSTPAASPASSSPTTGPVRTVTVAKHYLTTAQLRDDIESKTSLVCATYSEIRTPTGALARAECTTDVVLSIYADKADAEETIEELGKLVAGGLGSDSIHLLGENWTVNCSDDRPLCDELQRALGGELVVTKAG